MTLRSTLLPVLLVVLTALPVLAAEGPPPQFVSSWGSPGSGPGQFLYPLGMATDATGNLYVIDLWNDSVQKFSADGSFLTGWGTVQAGSGNGEFSGAWGIAVGPSGNIFVADTGNHRIQKFTPSGGFLAAWGSEGTGNLQFTQPVDVDLDASGNVYVVDRGAGRIQKLSGSGTFIAAWGEPGSATGQFNLPSGIAVDGSGTVYVSDTVNNRVQKFSSSGVFQSVFVTPGNQEGHLILPTGISTDGSGNVYVVDRGACNLACRVQKFTTDGSVLSIWGSSATGCQGSACDGKFETALDVAPSSSGNTVYVSDLIPRIQRFGFMVPVLPSTWGGLKTRY